MTDNTPEAQAHLPVTAEDRNLFKLIITGMVGPAKHNAIDGGGFDADERMQAIVRHRISQTQPEGLGVMDRLRSEIIKLHLECGSCSKWYTAQCPYETRLSGGKEGPSIEAARCRQFDLSDSIAGVIRRKEERIAELQRAALTPSALSGDNSQSSSNAGGVDEQALKDLAELPDLLAGHVRYHIREMYPAVLDAAPSTFLLSVGNSVRNRLDIEITGFLASLSTPTAEPPPTPDRIGKDAVREALAVGERFLNACNSAWAAGEPSHRVETMLNLADEFRAALDRALSASPAQPVDETERLRAGLEDIVRTYEVNDAKEGDDWEDGYDDALAECARIARAALQHKAEVSRG